MFFHIPKRKILAIIGMLAMFYILYLLFLSMNYDLDPHIRDQARIQIRHPSFNKSPQKQRGKSDENGHKQQLISKGSTGVTGQVKLEQSLPDEDDAVTSIKTQNKDDGLFVRRKDIMRQRIQMQPVLAAAGFESSQDEDEEKEPYDENDIIRWEQEQGKRLYQMREACRFFTRSQTPLTEWIKTHHVHLHYILVSDAHKALYCYVPKAACTNWKKAFLYLNGAVQNDVEARHMAHNRDNYTTLASYPEDEVLSKLQRYKKFIFGRHPRSRILSAYIEKFANAKRRGRRAWSINLGNAIYFQFGNHSIKNFRNLPPNGYNVTFEEFARYLGSPRGRFDLPGTEHWQPISDICFPCHIEYDIIGKFETFDFDTKQILRILNREDLTGVVLQKSDHSTGSSNKTLQREYYSKITRGEMRKLNFRFKTDLAMFGYSHF